MLATSTLALILATLLPPQQAPTTLADLFPPGRLACVRVPDGSALLGSRLTTATRALIAEQGDTGELWKLQAAVRVATGAEPEVILRALVGRESEWGLYAGRGRGTGARSRRLLAVLHTADATDLRRLLDAFVALLESGQRHSVERLEHAGRSLAVVDGRIALCAADELLFIATDDKLLRDALDRLPQSAPGVATDPEPGAAPSAAPGDVRDAGLLLTFEVDTGLLRSSDAKALAPPTDLAPRRFANPLANLLFAGVGATEGLLTGRLVEADERLILTAQLPAPPGEPARAYAPGGDAAMSVPVSEESAAVLFVRRDLADWWRHRETLLDDKLQARLAKFDQTLGLLFAGASPAEDVFARLEPELAVVVDRLVFDVGTTPDVRLPGACLVARVRDADSFRPSMQVAFQTLVGLANTERAKAGKPPFLLETAEHEGVTLRCARLLPGTSAAGMVASVDFEDGLDSELALAPALAFVDDVLLLGSSEEQVRRLVSALKAGSVRSVSGNSALQLDGDVLARLVRDNRGPLIAKAMLDDGLEPEAAGRRIDGLLAVLARVGALSLTLDAVPGGMQLRLQLDPPGERP